MVEETVAVTEPAAVAVEYGKKALAGSRTNNGRRTVVVLKTAGYSRGQDRNWRQ